MKILIAFLIMSFMAYVTAKEATHDDNEATTGAVKAQTNESVILGGPDSTAPSPSSARPSKY